MFTQKSLHVNKNVAYTIFTKIYVNIPQNIWPSGQLSDYLKKLIALMLIKHIVVWKCKK